MILQYKRVTFWLITTKSQYFFNLTRQRLARFKNFQLLGSCIKIWCNFPTWPTDGGILLTLMIDLTCQRLDPSLDFHIYFSSSSIQFTILPQGLSGQLLSPNHEVSCRSESSNLRSSNLLLWNFPGGGWLAAWVADWKLRFQWKPSRPLGLGLRLRVCQQHYILYKEGKRVP